MAKPKPIKLKAFKIDNGDPKYAKSPLLDMLGTKLESSSKAEDRRIQLNSNDPTEESDLIADFDISRKESIIHGTVLRVVASKGTPKIPDSVFNQPKIQYNSLKKLALTDKFIYRSHLYFATDGYHLVVTLPGTRTIKSFQTYVNEYLKAERMDHLFLFTPVISNTPQMRLGNIKSIKFKDSQLPVNLPDEDKPDIKTKMMKVTTDAVKSLFGDSPELEKILEEGIVSAELLIKFASNKKRPKDSQELLAPILKPMADTDDFEVKTKSGERIKGSTIQRSKDIELETTETDLINENQLFQEMENFLKELSN